MGKARIGSRVASLLLVSLTAVSLLAGCKTQQTRIIRPSGFLGDYSQMHKGKRGEGQLVYIAPNLDFTRYTKIMMDPVVAYSAENGELTKLKKQDLKTLLDYMDARFREELGKDYTLVSAPGPDVMRVRVAMTEADASHPVMDTVSSVVPVGIAVSTLSTVVIGEGTGVGRARAEAEVLDSMTGRRLAAAVDERAEGKYEHLDKWSRWQGARDAIDYWAVLMRTRFADMRAGRIK